LAEGALIQLSDTSEPAAELAQIVQGLLSDKKRRAEIGGRARGVCEKNRGATVRTLELLSTVLDARALATYEPPTTVQTATAK